jgi:hypothetical protein
MQILQGKYSGLRVLRELQPYHQVKSEKKEREYVVFVLYMIQGISLNWFHSPRTSVGIFVLLKGVGPSTTSAWPG